MICELIKKLSVQSAELVETLPITSQLIAQAADTIETLSAKLQAVNMEEENKRIKKNLKYGFCPDCGSAVGRGAGTCFECGAILDWDLLKEDDKRSAEDCGGWIPCKKRPQRTRDRQSVPVLVRYKDETALPDVCIYNFLTEKFVFIEKDVTDLAKEWRWIPGYEL